MTMIFGIFVFSYLGLTLAIFAYMLYLFLWKWEFTNAIICAAFIVALMAWYPDIKFILFTDPTTPYY